MAKNSKRKNKTEKANSSDVKPFPVKVTSENKCDLCTGSICCTYITHELDAPKAMKDFDYLMWQVSHENVAVFKDEDGWFLSITQPCVHLLPDGGRCGIYETRPEICREHSNDCCEFDGPAEEDFDLYFDSYESLDKFCRKRFKKWDKRFEKWYGKKSKKDKKGKKDKKAA